MKIKELQNIIEDLCSPAKLYLGVSSILLFIMQIIILTVVFPKRKNVNKINYLNIGSRFIFSIITIIWTTFIFQLLCKNDYEWIPWSILGFRGFLILVIIILYGNAILKKK
jgi:hypothetical protein